MLGGEGTHTQVSLETFYSRTFLQLLRIPALKNLGFSLYLKLWTSFTPSCSAACVFHRLSARTIILLPLLRLLRLNDISRGLRAPPTLRPILHLSMFGSLVRWPLTWRWLTSVVTPSHGHVSVGVPQGNISLVSIPVTSSNSFSLPLRPFLSNPGISPLPFISLRLPSKVALSSKTQTRSAILVQHRSLNSWASFCRSFCTTLSRFPGVRAWRPSHRHSTSFVSLYWTASTPLLKLASCHLSPCHSRF